MKKKLLLFLCTVILPALSAMASPDSPQPAFADTLNTSLDFERWTVVNNNDDNYFWRFNENEKCATFFNNPEAVADDALYSPVIQSDKGGTFNWFAKISFSNGNGLDIYVESEDKERCELIKTVNPSRYNSGVVYVNDWIGIGENEKLRFKFVPKAYNGHAKYSVHSITLFPSKKNKDLALTRKSGFTNFYYGETEVPISFWVLNNGMQTQSYFKILCSIDGSDSWEETIDLKKDNDYIIGNQEHQITLDRKLKFSGLDDQREVKLIVQSEGDENAENDTLTYTLYKKQYASLPYFNDFEENKDSIKTYHNPQSISPTWAVQQTRFGSSNWSMAYRKDYYDEFSDDWFFLPRARVEPGYYKISYDYNVYSTTYEVWYGNGPQVEKMQKRLKKKYATTPDYKSDSLIIHVEQAQDFCLGFHVLEDAANDIDIDNIRITPIEKPRYDVGIRSLKFDPDKDFLMKGQTANIQMHNKNNAYKEIIKNVTSRVKIGDKVLAENLEDCDTVIVGGCVFLEDFEDFEPGDYVMKGEISAPGDEVESNNYIEFPFRLIGGKPYQTYDFEDGLLPKGFQTIQFDVSDVVDAPHDAPWYVEELEANNMNVTGLCSRSLLKSDGYIDRWIILPQIHVNEGTADLIWNAYTFKAHGTNDSGYAKYQVLVAENGKELYNFKLEKDLQAPYYNTEFNRLKLDKYAGKDIYVAFRNITTCGNILCLDNISMYGDFSEVQTGISQTSTNSLQVKVKNGILVCSEEADRLEIFDLTGRVVSATSKTSSVSVQSLSSGTYIARIQYKGQMQTVKFVK